MVEKAYFVSLNKELNEDSFIRCYKNKLISISAECRCPNSDCMVPLQPIGIEKLQRGEIPKLKGFRIKSNEEINHHIYGCDQLSAGEARKEIVNETKELADEINADRGITLEPTRSRRASSKGKNDPTLSENNGDTGTNQRNIGGKTGKTIHERSRISNIGTLTGLFFDGTVSNETSIKMAINIADVNGTTGYRTLNELFFSIDDNPTSIPLNEFHVFFGKVTSSKFGSSNSSAISFKFFNATNYSVSTNIKKLKKMCFGNHILKSHSRADQTSILYFEGYFFKEGNRVKAHQISDSFAQDIFMRKNYD